MAEPTQKGEVGAQPLWALVHTLPNFPQEYAANFRRLGIHKGLDLVFHFPRSYEEAVPTTSIADFEDNLRVSFSGVISDTDERVTQSGKHMLGAQVTPDEGGAVRLVWFNQPFRRKELRPGRRLRATGLVRSTVLNWQITQPQVTYLDTDPLQAEEEVTAGPQPVYPLTEGSNRTNCAA